MNHEISETVKQLKALLLKRQAHVTLDDALEAVPFHLLGVVPAGLPYSIWQITEHIRICQWDILEFSRDANHVSPKWPDDCWPKTTAPATEDDWHVCIRQIKHDLQQFLNLLDHEDLFTPFAWGDGQNLMREAMLIADHNSYHIGEIIILRRLLGAWK